MISKLLASDQGANAAVRLIGAKAAGAALVVLLAGPAAARPGSPASQPDIETITFVDYWSHAGPGPHPTDCSGSFRFISGGIRWPAAAVTYDLLTGTIPAGLSSGAVASAVQAALDAWTDADTDGDATNAPAFSDSGATDPDTVGWASLGTTGIVAATSVSYLPASKTITGFDLTFNSDLAWSATGAADTFDVRNVGTHEAGHAFGMDHVSAPKDGLETMYRLTAEQEVLKQTLCTGDVAGIQALY